MKKTLKQYSRSELKFFIKSCLSFMSNDLYFHYNTQYINCENDKTKLYKLAKMLNKR